MWELTAAGRRRLRAARAAGRVPDLPESPQHRAWRNARTAAANEIERFTRSLGADLDQATRLLEADPPARSDAWFEGKQATTLKDVQTILPILELKAIAKAVFPGD